MGAAAGGRDGTQQVTSSGAAPREVLGLGFLEEGLDRGVLLRKRGYDPDRGRLRLRLELHDVTGLHGCLLLGAVARLAERRRRAQARQWGPRREVRRERADPEAIVTDQL